MVIGDDLEEYAFCGPTPSFAPDRGQPPPKPRAAVVTWSAMVTLCVVLVRLPYDTRKTLDGLCVGRAPRSPLPFSITLSCLFFPFLGTERN
jgi:hypothetical protein